MTDVGVVVVVRNGVVSLPAALRSVVEQDPPPVDVLVVDGGSSDGSAEVAAATPGVRVIGQRGLGLGGARNQGIAAVAGEIIAFCDADDRWAPSALRTKTEHLAAEPDCDAVIGDVVMTPLEGQPVPPRQADRLDRPLPGFTPGAVLIRRSALDRIGPFDEELSIGTDTDWFVRAASANVRIDQVDSVVLYKGVRPASLSTDVEAYRRELMTVAWAHVRRTRGR